MPKRNDFSGYDSERSRDIYQKVVHGRESYTKVAREFNLSKESIRRIVFLRARYFRDIRVPCGIDRIQALRDLECSRAEA